MGVLIKGRWREEDLPQEVAPSGEFKRVESRFRDRITQPIESRVVDRIAVALPHEWSVGDEPEPFEILEDRGFVLSEIT